MTQLNDFIAIPFTQEIQKDIANEFDCGNDYITGFLHKSDALNSSYGKTYVWITEGQNEIIGYYNIEMSYVEDEDGIKQGGAAHINYFAIDKKWQGKTIDNDLKFSDLLLNDCINRIDFIRENMIGCSFITLFSTPEGENLYLRNDFENAQNEDMSAPPGMSEKTGGKLMFLCLDIE